ncbi:MAG: hypothetical protein DLM68_01075 [Hyphomicrobiales bacterium]|nr:MAG: hypothetical protein DLM68_01075 [Hyphomicrobiales bacterium]
MDAMRIKLNNLTGIASLKAGHFDLHQEFGVACLVEEGERVTLCINQATCRSWLKQEHPNIEKIKWLDLNAVILYYDEFGVRSYHRKVGIAFGLVLWIIYFFQEIIFSFLMMSSLTSDPGLTKLKAISYLCFRAMDTWSSGSANYSARSVSRMIFLK